MILGVSTVSFVTAAVVVIAILVVLMYVLSGRRH